MTRSEPNPSPTLDNRTSGGVPTDLTPSIIMALRSGNAGAGDTLDRLYRPAMLRFCLGYLGSPADAEDAVQETFCRVLGSDVIPDAFRPWLYKIARNQCLQVLRTRGRNRTPDALPPASILDAELTGHLTAIVVAEQRGHLLDLMADLTAEQREVLQLRYREELSRLEIAEVLDLPESVVKSRLFEAVKKLRGHDSLAD